MGDGPEWSEIEVVLTPGERFQNWLAARGLCERVQRRDCHHPEPPSGFWSAVNGVMALGAFAILCGMLWLAIFHALPALVGVNDY